LPVTCIEALSLSPTRGERLGEGGDQRPPGFFNHQFYGNVISRNPRGLNIAFLRIMPVLSGGFADLFGHLHPQPGGEVR